MQSPPPPSTSRYQCFRRIWRSLREGSLTMDRKMAEVLGITINSTCGEECTAISLSVSSTSSDITSSVYIESLSVAACLRNAILALSSQGMCKLSQWPNSYRVWDPYWGFTAIMTTGDIALAITVHSHTASNAEILTTEFVACYLVADIAWQDNRDQNDFENTRASTQTQQRLLRRLPIRIISIHRRNIRVLNTTFTEQYYESLSKAGQTVPSNLPIHVDSFPALRYDDDQITHIAQKLMI